MFAYVFAVAGDDVIRSKNWSGHIQRVVVLRVQLVQLLFEHRMFPLGGKWDDLTLELTVFNPIIIYWQFFRKTRKNDFQNKALHGRNLLFGGVKGKTPTLSLKVEGKKQSRPRLTVCINIKLSPWPHVRCESAPSVQRKLDYLI